MNRLEQFRSAAECVLRVQQDPRVRGACSLAPQIEHGRIVRLTAVWIDNSQKTFAVHTLDDGGWRLGRVLVPLSQN